MVFSFFFLSGTAQDADPTSAKVHPGGGTTCSNSSSGYTTHPHPHSKALLWSMQPGKSPIVQELGNDRVRFEKRKKAARWSYGKEMRQIDVFCMTSACLHNCIPLVTCCLLFICSCLTALGWLRQLSGNFSLLSGIPKWLNQGVYSPASMELLVLLLWSSSECWHLEAGTQQPGWWVILRRAFSTAKASVLCALYIDRGLIGGDSELKLKWSSWRRCICVFWRNCWQSSSNDDLYTNRRPISSFSLLFFCLFVLRSSCANSHNIAQWYWPKADI